MAEKRVWLLVILVGALAWMIRAERVRKAEASHNVVVSEFMAVNTEGLLDEDGDSSDWIELFNRGEEDADLTGSFLTDDMTTPRKWPLPPLVLEPGEAVVVFASGKDRRSGELHTNFRLSDAGEFLGLVSPDGTMAWGFQPEYPEQHPDTSFGLGSSGESLVLVGPDATVRVFVPEDHRYDESWMSPAFDDSTWGSGRGAVGFEEGYQYDRLIQVPLDRMFKQSISAYLRIPFRVDEPDAVTGLQLRIKYDDGFIAYLNGRRVAAGNAPVDPSWNARAASSRPDEIAMVFEPFDLADFRDLLVEGENVLAIHGFNRSKGSKDFLVSAVLEAFVGDAALGDAPLYLDASTPGRANGPGFASLAAAPYLLRESGLYAAPVTVEIEAAPGQEIRYTTDGSRPTRTSALYEAPLRFERSTLLTARCFAPNVVGSVPVSGHYLVAEPDFAAFDSDLPLVLIETFEKEVHPDGFSPAYLHVYDGGERTSPTRPVFAGAAAVKHRGSTTLSYPKRSYAIEIQEELGRDRAVELLGMPADSDWILYAPYNYDRAMIRNALVYELSNQIGRYAPRTRFVEVFVHSKGGAISERDYRGLYVLMEKIKRAPHRVDIRELRPSHDRSPQITGGYLLKIDRKDPGDRGFSAGGQKRLNYVDPKEAHITEEQAEWLASYLDDFGASLETGEYEDFIDVDSWIDYHILQELARNPDGHRYSTFFSKRRGGKLEMGPVWDLDRAMGADDTQRSRTPPDPRPVGRSRVHSYGWWEQLMQDPEFLRRYRARWHVLREGPLATENVTAIVDAMEAELAEAQERNFERWPIDLGENGWRGKVEHVRNWLVARLEWMDEDLAAR